MTAIPPGWTPEQARKRLEAATARIRPQERDDGWTDAETGEWVSMPATVRALTSPKDCEALLADIAALLALLDDARERLTEQAVETEDGLCWCPDWFHAQEQDTGYQRDVTEHNEACRKARAFLARFAADSRKGDEE